MEQRVVSSRPSAQTNALRFERNIARARMTLSLMALLALCIDPTRSSFAPPTALPPSGPLPIDPYARDLLALHLLYSLTLHALVRRAIVRLDRLAKIATWGDVLFGWAIALLTEGAATPFYPFFAFAVLGVGLREGLRATLTVTGVSVVLYLGLIFLSAPDAQNFYVMRPVNLAITGYLVGYLGQQRRDLEANVRSLQIEQERRSIARTLHDGYVQALAGVNLRLATCRELLCRGRYEAAAAELSGLRASVLGEYDAVRAYIHSLTDREGAAGSTARHVETRFSVHADFDGASGVVEHALAIMLEGARNVVRHAQATSATISVTPASGGIRIAIDDDGTGFPSGGAPPWSIASRATESAGRVSIDQTRPGGHLLVELSQG
ncbi:MAG TPA: histidine kinase [Candidatus Binatia bacterium]|nr:histidine kinase [Candidatus Binatia bacterium]